MPEARIGVVTHYFGKIGVAAIRITDGELNVGDTVRIKGHTSDFSQPVESMQMEHESIDSARAGDEVAIRVVQYTREHDIVFKLID
jgi:putative protease